MTNKHQVLTKPQPRWRWRWSAAFVAEITFGHLTCQCLSFNSKRPNKDDKWSDVISEHAPRPWRLTYGVVSNNPLDLQARYLSFTETGCHGIPTSISVSAQDSLSLAWSGPRSQFVRCSAVIVMSRPKWKASVTMFHLMSRRVHYRLLSECSKTWSFTKKTCCAGKSTLKRLYRCTSLKNCRAHSLFWLLPRVVWTSKHMFRHASFVSFARAKGLVSLTWLTSIESIQAGDLLRH